MPLYGVDSPLFRELSDAEIDARLEERSRLTDAYLQEMSRRSQESPYRDDAYGLIPGRGYLSGREANAEYALSASPSRQPISPRTIRPLEMMEAAFDVPVGLLAGLSSETANSKGFAPEARKALMGLIDPAQGVDEASYERLFRRRDGEPMGMAEQVVASSLLFPGALRAGGMRYTPGTGYPAFLEGAGKSMRLPNAMPAPRRGLPLR
jgi:hypothetical protein